MRRAAVIEGRQAKRQSSGEAGDYFASMTDLMLGLIFVFIIMLMGFVLNLHEAEHKLTTTVSELTDADSARRELLRAVASILKGTLPVTIDEGNGTLQLGGDILFPKGSADAYPDALPKLRLLAEALARVLPCYATAGDREPAPPCTALHKGRLDAVYIEGHTDNTPIRTTRFQSNWELSAARAAVTFNELVAAQPALGLIENGKGEHLIGVSGYGEYRPVDPGTSDAAMQRNRRIELRFVMVAPHPGEIGHVTDQIDRHGAP